MAVAIGEKYVVMQINKIKLLGGSRDGELLDLELDFVPDIIDGEAIHVFGRNAYALVEANYNTGVALFECMKLLHNVNDESLD